ncbi:myb/SANT-like DNA-binding domain-containing protein 4 [Colossoma macropomum]|uniref:myb/SANT-like DNA-binding domain-containing protein 4 n=1 Tax=Colossoma macropomum TaxID=42526 RepID=UPI0018655B61|nr:myb/SANT-like DNA-binding domain-containing protein 4 [Colossoma macropomum]XP_036413898.1 myb/SANT-like DNA-binding domain-containing protein 4 [Colossoma macropomum]
MDFLQMKHLKRKRKSNYSVRETQTLIREIQRRRDVLFSRQQNTAVNELKRRAWEEVAECVNALGEGEVRTAGEVKRRYLDWRTLMKRKQLRAQLAAGLQPDYDPPCSPDNEGSLGGEPPQEPAGFQKDPQGYWQDLPDLGENSVHCGVKMEDTEGSGYNLDGGVCDSVPGEIEGEGDDDDEDCFPSILQDVDREGTIPEDFAHIDEFGVLSCSKAPAGPSLARDLGPDTPGTPGVGGATPGPPAGDSTGLLVALEKQRLELEKQRLQVESERLQVEKERLQVEKKRLCQAEMERERLQLEKERLDLERERLRLLVQQSALPQQSPASSTTAATPTTSSAPSSSSSLDVEKDRKPPWPVWTDLEAEKLKLEKERLLLEKERLQFFRFESGRLQIERERLQVEKERLQLHKDGQQMALHS